MNEREQETLEAVRELGVAPWRDLESRGLHHEYLRSLVEKGLVTRLARGVYAPAGLHETSLDNLEEAMIMVPNGVICLLSALNYYEVGTQSPPRTWMAISRRARMPRNTPEWIQVVRFSESTVDLGIDHVQGRRRPIAIYSLGRTVIDCFKHRKLVGLDVAVEALQDVRRRRLVSVSELAGWGEQLGMLNTVRPYLEVLA